LDKKTPEKQQIKSIKSVLIGTATGFANGLFGAGGGTILVPALERFLGVEAHKAHATAISVILPLSVISAIVYFKSGVFDLRLCLYITAGGVFGGFLGAKILRRFSSGALRIIFGVFIIIAAVRMFF